MSKILDRIEAEKTQGPKHGWRDAVALFGTQVLGLSCKRSTQIRYICSLGQVDPILGKLYVEDISRKEIAAVVGRKGITNATRRRDLTAVSVVLRACVAWGWIDVNPAAIYDRGTIRERRDPITLPRPEDIDRVVNALPGNLARLVRFAQYTGMRQEEIASLERSQVRGSVVDLTKTKTDSPRSIPLDERGVGTLAGTVPALHSSVVFHHGGERYRNVASRFRGYVQRIAEKAKAESFDFKAFRFHDLRHWYAVDYLRSSRGSIYDLQKLLGHRSIKTTELYLAYLTPDEQRNSVTESAHESAHV